MYIPLTEQAKIESCLTAINAGEDLVFNPSKLWLLFEVVKSIFFALFACWFYYQDSSSFIILILGIVIFCIAIPDCIRLFTQDGLLILNYKGLTHLNYEQEKKYAWHQIDSVSFRSTRLLSYLYIKLKENGNLKQIGCYSSYKEISLSGLMEVLNRKLKESPDDKDA